LHGMGENISTWDAERIQDMIPYGDVAPEVAI
jgi:hypothetical protein